MIASAIFILGDKCGGVFEVVFITFFFFAQKYYFLLFLHVGFLNALKAITMIYLDEHIESIDVVAVLAEVSEQRRELAMRFLRESSRQQSLAAYLLLKKGLRMEYGIQENPILAFTADGKPFIENRPDIHFNLSHSKTVALCAISEQPVGADVEVLRPVSAQLIDYTMNEEERAWIQNSRNPDEAFMTLWTRKEAVLKLTGEGIRKDLKNVLDGNTLCQIETVSARNYIYSIARFK